jgi:hypothetical protein
MIDASKLRGYPFWRWDHAANRYVYVVLCDVHAERLVPGSGARFPGPQSGWYGSDVETEQNFANCVGCMVPGCEHGQIPKV